MRMQLYANGVDLLFEKDLGATDYVPPIGSTVKWWDLVRELDLIAKVLDVSVDFENETIELTVTTPYKNIGR